MSVNLAQMISMAGSILDYSPDVPTYRAELRRYLDESQRELFSMREWLFGQKVAHVQLHPDVTVAALTITRLIGTQGTNLTVLLQDPGARGIVPVWVDNAVVEISAATGLTQAVPVEVAVRMRVSSDSVVLEDSDGQNLLAAFGTATAVTAVFKHRFVDMPTDMVDVMSVTVREPNTERESIHNITRWEDENYLLNIDIVGRPTNFVLASDAFVPSPVKVPTCVNAGAAASPFPAGDYDVVYTHILGGRESASSPNSLLVTFAAGDNLNISGMQNNGNDNDTGLYKKVYFRGPDSDAFYATENDASTEEATTMVASAQIRAGYLRTSVRLPEHDGTYSRLRMYPRQDSEITVNVRYMARPPRLIDDSDSPLTPSEHHKYLVFRCCEQLFVKHGNPPLSEKYRLLAEAELVRMAKRYLTTKSQLLVKGNFTQSRRMGRPWRTLTHT